MKRGDPHFEDLLPIQLKLRLLEVELDRLQADADWIEKRRSEVVAEVDYYRGLLENRKRQRTLRRVK
ncbi:MAG TPA: hypothetical protein VKZ59_08020 [Acidobacteriota bacterium]|nr:hypothetical protein [Acidobacteriota bacterium]